MTTERDSGREAGLIRGVILWEKIKSAKKYHHSQYIVNLMIDLKTKYLPLITTDSGTQKVLLNLANIILNGIGRRTKYYSIFADITQSSEKLAEIKKNRDSISARYYELSKTIHLFLKHDSGEVFEEKVSKHIIDEVKELHILLDKLDMKIHKEFLAILLSTKFEKIPNDLGTDLMDFANNIDKGVDKALERERNELL